MKKETKIMPTIEAKTKMETNILQLQNAIRVRNELIEKQKVDLLAEIENGLAKNDLAWGFNITREKLLSYIEQLIKTTNDIEIDFDIWVDIKETTEIDLSNISTKELINLYNAEVENFNTMIEKEKARIKSLLKKNNFKAVIKINHSDKANHILKISSMFAQYQDKQVINIKPLLIYLD